MRGSPLSPMKESGCRMYVAVDDTDSCRGMCTTYLLAKMIAEMPYDLIGMPRLVRLNPAVPWKTRGNGALSMRIGIGGGERTLVGESRGHEIFCYSYLKEEPNAKEVLHWASRYLDDNAEPDANPGLIVSLLKPPQRLYWSGVRDILLMDDVKTILSGMGALIYSKGNGRGVIGAACGMAWRPRDRTLELLAYRPRERWGTDRYLDPDSVERMDSETVSTFNNIEIRRRKVAISPSTPCPVLYGIRGEDREELLTARRMLVSEEPEMWLIFMTNQGTDDHMVKDAATLLPNRSYRLKATVAGRARDQRGGHVFIPVRCEHGIIECAAYEPSKEFRSLIRALRPGDVVEVMGELRETPRSLNLEKVRVLEIAESRIKTANPRCPRCGRAMKSVGRDAGYRCRNCSVYLSEEQAPTEPESRQLVPGWYEPPVCSRRHLSKPLCRMGEYQPIDFV